MSSWGSFIDPGAQREANLLAVRGGQDAILPLGPRAELHTDLSCKSRSNCSSLELGFSASVVVFSGDEESGELGLDLPRQRGAQQTPGESKTHKLAPVLRYFFSLIPTPNCRQVQQHTKIDPDAMPVPRAAACKIYLQLGRNTRRESRCEWLRARRELGPPRGHKQVPWGG